MASPVSPAVVRVVDASSLANDLSLPTPVGSDPIDVILPGGLSVRVVTDAEAPGGRHFVRFCAADLSAVAEHAAHLYGDVPLAHSFTVDPDTMRLRSVVLSTPDVVVTAVRCLDASDCGVPCGQACSPSSPPQRR